MSREQWKWFGNAAHFICGNDCRFHLATLLPNGYLVSTVGQLWPSRGVREIHADVHDPKWLAANKSLKGDTFDHAYMQRFGYYEIGYQRTFETMVFKAGKPCEAEGCDCGQPSLGSGVELDMLPADTAGQATTNHYALCDKWAAKKERVKK